MKQNDFLKFLCRAPERECTNHSSSLFSICSSTEIISFNFSPKASTHTHVHNTQAFFLSSLTCLFLSGLLHVSVLLLYECTLTYSHTCELTLKHSVTCPLFFSLSLGQYIKNCPHFSSCLSSESLSLCFLFPFCLFFFFWCFLSLPILPSWQICWVTVLHTWSRCALQVSDGGRYFRK